MHRPRKIGKPPLSCSNNFAEVISAKAPDTQLRTRLAFNEWLGCID
jgi:hypothetical protein